MQAILFAAPSPAFIALLASSEAAFSVALFGEETIVAGARDSAVHRA